MHAVQHLYAPACTPQLPETPPGATLLNAIPRWQLFRFQQALLRKRQLHEYAWLQAISAGPKREERRKGAATNGWPRWSRVCNLLQLSIWLNQKLAWDSGSPLERWSRQISEPTRAAAWLELLPRQAVPESHREATHDVPTGHPDHWD